MDDLALDGRQLGKRGAATRRRLLDATTLLLETHGIRDLRVVDIAREVGTSPATFYQYFRDVEEAVLVLAAEVGEETAPMLELLQGDWRGKQGLQKARQLVDDFIVFWDAHRAVLRTRNLAAQEGDQRFRTIRNASLRPVTEGLAELVPAGDLSPIAAASALVAMMERMAAFHVDLGSLGASRADIVETVAHIVHRTVTAS
ncbi:MAG: transcriptional regulator, TetR family [Actinomycetia bacterium]|nr:transcriptional regulator, TetR family [Actinomycetes bacterium]